MYYSTKETKELINHQLDCCFNHYLTADSSSEKSFWLYYLTEARKLKNCSFREFKSILNNINYDFKNCSYYTYSKCQKMMNKYFI